MASSYQWDEKLTRKVLQCYDIRFEHHRYHDVRLPCKRLYVDWSAPNAHALVRSLVVHTLTIHAILQMVAAAQLGWRDGPDPGQCNRADW